MIDSIYLSKHNNAETTSYRHRCNSLVLHRRRYDVVAYRNVRWGTPIPLIRFVLLFRLFTVAKWHIISCSDDIINSELRSPKQNTQRRNENSRLRLIVSISQPTDPPQPPPPPPSYTHTHTHARRHARTPSIGYSGTAFSN